VLFQVCRFEPKDFRQRRPDGKDGWIWSVKGTRQVPYRLPELLAAPAETAVFIVEGEKDVLSLVEFGLVATCNPGGAAKRKADGELGKPKWRPELNPFFRDRDVVILPDNDNAGRDHARSVAASLARVAARVRILELPGMADKGDVSDWLAEGGTRDELLRLASAAPDFEPERSGGTAKDGWPGDEAEDAGKEPQAQILIRLAETSAQLFCDRGRIGYADVRISGHRETWRVGSQGFRLWLTQRYYRARGGAPNATAMLAALNVIEARARFDGAEREVYVRIAGAGDKLYLDLCDPTWRAVEIAAAGWRVIAEAPVRFRRAKGMLPLPVPVAGSDIT
jgi:hypothetical protein